MLVARAVEQRLSEPDLAGPWPPLTTREEEFMSLSGRWPSRNYVGTLVKRAYDVPSDLLLRMRAASYRVSEGPLAELEDRGLTFARLDLSDEDQELRDALVDKVFPVPRIVREALENFGPWLRPDATEAGEL
ncbi:hypothetical protein ACIP9H_33955 [Streptomyces sp. NPDC088732]|uniref:hypothetical protein n=1 Tax=Streptomyces sp. NPDC088732 TaxID=3365879 RepID=UPI00380BFF6F